MTAARRRIRRGIPLAVIIAVLTAVFASRTARAPTSAPQDGHPPAAAPAAPAPERSQQSPARTANDGDAANGSGARGAESIGFTSRQRLVEHFDKHGDEFPGLDIGGYLAAAQALRDASAGGSVLELRRRDGVVTRFDRTTGAFLAYNRDGTIRTFFRPNDGEAYFRRQVSRTPGGGP